MFKFTDDQLAIIHAEEKRVVVQAGPGSGKSTTIAGAVAYQMAEHKHSGYDFLIITFSRFAARQIREKIQGLDPVERNKIDVDTFHGFALKIINKFTATSWTIMDEKDLIHVMDGNGYWPLNTKFKDFINGKITAPSARRENIKAFEKICNQFKWITYNQLLTTLVKNKDAMAWLQSRYKFLYVDEAQDMNPAQLNIAKLMDIEYTTYVGDVSQSIYEWNGAAPRILMDLSEKYKTYTLSENHRSNSDIVEASSKLIMHNKLRISGKNTPTRGFDTRCINVHHRDEMHSSIANSIQEYSDDGELAILCRTNREIAEIILELGNLGIDKSLPASVLRSNPLFMMIVALVRLRTDPCKPYWMLFLRDNAAKDGFSFSYDKYSFSEPTSKFANMAPEWVDRALEIKDFGEFLEYFLKTLGSEDFSDDAILASRLIKAFREASDGAEEEFLAWFATMDVQDIVPEETSGVRIMTMHQAKGLEFDHVIVVLPKYDGKNEESRRIVFVSVTRAIKTLDIIAYPDNNYLEEMGLSIEDGTPPLPF